MNVAHQMTDNLLIQLEQRVNAEYAQAAREVEGKMNDYLAAFARRDEAQLARLQNGDITQNEYNQWRIGQIAIGHRWSEMRDTLAQDLTNTNQIAAAMINGNSRDVYALNHNYGTFEVEEQSQIDTSYTLYDRWTVERLLRDDPDLLPQARIDIPEDLRWNRLQINSAITQGVLQGESIPDIARRLESVTNMNRTSAIRNARTMTTSAECGGRLDSYIRAENMGIEMKQAWVATHDSRTRFSHAQMDGETAAVGEKFSNGCKFPGDPEGKPEEVYNCRCTIVGIVEGSTLSDDMLSRREYWDNDERFQEWENKNGNVLTNSDAELRRIENNTYISPYNGARITMSEFANPTGRLTREDNERQLEHEINRISGMIETGVREGRSEADIERLRSNLESMEALRRDMQTYNQLQAGTSFGAERGIANIEEALRMQPTEEGLRLLNGWVNGAEANAGIGWREIHEMTGGGLSADLITANYQGPLQIAAENERTLLQFDTVFHGAEVPMTTYKGLSATYEDIEGIREHINNCAPVFNPFYSSTSSGERVAYDYAMRALDTDDMVPLEVTYRIEEGTPVADVLRLQGENPNLEIASGMSGYEQEIVLGRNVEIVYTNLQEHELWGGEEVYYTVDAIVRRVPSV